MLKTMNCSNIPARVIVSKENMFKDKHRFMAEWDFDRNVLNKDEYLKKLLKDQQMPGIYIRTKGGAHFISTRFMSLQQCSNFASWFNADPKWIKMNEKRGYFSLRVTQKYISLDLDIDRSYVMHNEELAKEYERLKERYKDYFTFRHPIKAYRMNKAAKEQDLLTQYTVKHNLEEKPIVNEPIYESSY